MPRRRFSQVDYVLKHLEFYFTKNFLGSIWTYQGYAAENRSRRRRETKK